MSRTCGSSFNRQQLLESEVAVCYYCAREFPPSEIVEWCDGDAPGQTAMCPYCSVDAVVGWNGAVDHRWVAKMHNDSFE